jgi:HD-GYP domain-containing protein (c-di-GMP phosphodiesterase class II)
MNNFSGASNSTDDGIAENKIENLLSNIKKLTDVGIALSSEEEMSKLLEKIVDIASDLTNADGGTLYIKSEDGEKLCFGIVRNDSLDIRMGGTRGKITWEPINLMHEDGSENEKNVSAHVALTGEMVNIEDVYSVEGFDFKGTRDFDQKTGYRSQSMLVLPLKDHEGEIIGVLQLINSKDKNGKTVPFSPESQALAASLASQAAVSMTKKRLIESLQLLFDSFIRTIAKAIDEKSPYTGGHIRRVAEISMAIAEKINSSSEGVYKYITLNEDEMRELSVAAWLHDIGKITTPEYVVDKSSKLETIYDRIEEINTRFEILKRDAEILFLKKRLAEGEGKPKNENDSLETEYKNNIKELEENFKFLKRVNIGGESLSDKDKEKIEELGKIAWKRGDKNFPLLNNQEKENLSISRGTLNDEERRKIQDHVRLTEEMLNELPFPKKLKNVPAYAAAHHETLDGSGYHKGLKGEELSLQARIIAVADIFEALSASDRPYKKGKTQEEIVEIMERMVKEKHIDADIYALFIENGLYKDFWQT